MHYHEYRHEMKNPNFKKAMERISSLEEENRRLREALRSLVGYCTWQIKEGTDHHPTLPSAVAIARAALSQEEKPCA